MGSRQIIYLVVGIVLGLVLGVLLGMALFWGPFAVEWTDARSYDLGPEAKAEYMALVADSFKLDKDPARADAFLYLWEPEEKQQAVADAVEAYDLAGRDDKVQTMNDLAMALAIEPLPESTPPPPTVEPPTTGVWNRLRVPCLVFLFVLLVLVLALIVVRALFRRGSKDQSPGVAESPPPVAPRPETPATVADESLGRFFTEYHLGEDTYDESFSIEAPTGEFLGECGMGISETIGDGEPDKVTAFEVWLFDKSDIRTVTKVLMSEYAFHDEAMRAKLAPKGEAVLAQPAVPVRLGTSRLQVQVNVTDMDYGRGDLPPNSHFAKLMVELVATAKPSESEDDLFS
jgi:hypothetical protein